MDDFNFLACKNWTVKNYLLEERMSDIKKWKEFDAKLSEFQIILDGLGNIDKFKGERDGVKFEASSLRLYNEQQKIWSIYWIDNISQELIPQVTGKFKNGVGEFYGEELYKGKSYKMRFLWTDISDNSARWEQAYYNESTQEWETNWIMEFKAD